MKKNVEMEYAVTTNRVLLGLMFLVAGLTKLFVFKVAGVTSMLAGLGIPLASFMAWILILSEIVFGAMFIAGYRLRCASWPLIVIMVVAAFTSSWGNWGSVLMHLAVAANLWTFAAWYQKK